MTLGDLVLEIWTKAIFDNISDTIYSRVMRHGPKVAWEETFKMMCHWVTFSLYIESKKKPIFDHF